jgi:hypothetical protein
MVIIVSIILSTVPIRKITRVNASHSIQGMVTLGCA